uniref:Uncharacterized protein n=1 Tax=Arundo donax TaxID=35708 RepID=A0A0A9ERC3_ARUDO
MPRKAGPQESEELPIHPYEAERLRQCMRNNARLKQLGIPPLAATVFTKKTSITSDKNKPKHSNCEDSESEYDPQQDHTAEEDFFDANTAKVLTPSILTRHNMLLFL